MTARPPRDDFDARADALFRELTQETDELLTAPTPAEIRRRGEQRRTRRHTGIAAGTLGIGLLAAASAFSLGGGALRGHPSVDPAGTPSPATSRVQLPTSRPSVSTPPATSAPQPSASSTQPSAPSTSLPASTAVPTATTTVTTTATASSTPTGSGTSSASAPASAPPPAASSIPASVAAPTWDDLPTASELARTGQSALTQDVETTELPQESFSLCQVDIKDLSQKNLLVRHFTSGDGAVTAYAVAFGYDTPEQAVAARKILRGWYTGCAARLQAAGKPGAKQTQAHPIPLAGKAGQVIDPVDGASFRQVSHGVEGGDTGVFEEATIIQAGNRLEWVVYTVQGTDDNNWDTSAGGPVGAVYPGIAHAQSWADKLLP
ncbi:hypothetical protein AAEX63_05130 [Luteococcus sp. H138]|uniref:hypothetical protein n=1 Tax=unclassified Luteococcus TaxID=2639923 RepID=UPI00313D68A7